MSGLMDKLTGHHHNDKTETNTTSHSGHSGLGHHSGQTTTTTQTTTSTSNPTLNQQQNYATGTNASNTAVGTTAPYGASSNATTARTGAAYTGAEGNQAFTQQRGVTGEDAMTRSEEQLRLATARVETGKAELNKYVTTEHVEKAIPISRERLIIEREPINQTNLSNFSQNLSIGEQHFETTICEDRMAAIKETVPIERIRLAKETETAVETVAADLRKEHVDFTQTQLPASKIDSGLHGGVKNTGLSNHVVQSERGGIYQSDKVDNIGTTDVNRNAAYQGTNPSRAY